MSEQDKNNPENNNGDIEAVSKVTEPEVTQELSKVAGNPKQSAVILGAVILAFMVFIYNMYIKDSIKEEETPRKLAAKLNKDQITNPIPKDFDRSVPIIPQLPEPPKVEAKEEIPEMPAIVESQTEPQGEDLVTPPPLDIPTPPKLPGSAPQLAENNNGGKKALTVEELEAIEKRKEQKRKSGIIQIGGGAPAIEPPIELTANVSKMNHPLKYTIAKGKVIEGALESALNTDFGGEIRGIVTEDVYSEAGINILIPRGSRLLGTYNTTVDGIYGRIDVIWNRITTPEGIIVNLNNALALDNLGRKGIRGKLDEKNLNKISNAVLLTAFNVTLAETMNSLVKPAKSNTESGQLTQVSDTLRTGAASTFASSSTPAEKKTSLCETAKQTLASNITQGKTVSDALNELNTYCLDSNNATNVDGIYNLINSIANKLVLSAAEAQVETEAQKAAREGIENIGGVMKDILSQDKVKPNVTVNQGTKFKIMVQQDFFFPKKLVQKSRLLN